MSKSTDTLWTETHSALCAGQWGKARALLDDLGRRSDNRSHLAHISSYVQCAYERVVDIGQLATLLQDRIDLVNSKLTC